MEQIIDIKTALTILQGNFGYMYRVGQKLTVGAYNN